MCSVASERREPRGDQACIDADVALQTCLHQQDSADSADSADSDTEAAAASAASAP